MLRMVDLITKKRNGGEFSKEEIGFFIEGCIHKAIPDYQISALLMAICFVGMTKQETADLTIAMARSGDCIDLSSIQGIKVDKHSTGGVGDTTTLILAPLVAACGVPVAKMSGRGLGHTGGTLDKLESIPGVRIDENIDDFIEIVRSNKLAIIGQTDNLVPADKIVYALRDVTGTVDSIPLIASSIMSKKIAAGCDAIVLDVKTGSGAFMREKEDAFALGSEMVGIGALVNRETIAVITDMNQPLGMAVGNALEVVEAIEALSGSIDCKDPLMDVSLLLGSYMLMLAKAADSIEDARNKLIHALHSGAGKQKLRELITALGGDGSCIDYPESLLKVHRKIDLSCQTDGFIASMDTMQMGLCAQLLGAGRATKTDIIDPYTGFVMKKRIGDCVHKGDTLCTLYVNDDKRLDEVTAQLRDAIHIESQKPVDRSIVYGIITKDQILANCKCKLDTHGRMSAAC